MHELPVRALVSIRQWPIAAGAFIGEALRLGGNLLERFILPGIGTIALWPRLVAM